MDATKESRIELWDGGNLAGKQSTGSPFHEVQVEDALAPDSSEIERRLALLADILACVYIAVEKHAA